VKPSLSISKVVPKRCRTIGVVWASHPTISELAWNKTGLERHSITEGLERSAYIREWINWEKNAGQHGAERESAE
jgi:hypothetical protein